MVSSDLLTDIDSRSGEIHMMIPEKAFAGLSVMTVADLLQLPPVRGKLIFSQFFNKDNMKHLLVSQLWDLFKYAELTEGVRQNGKLFINWLYKSSRQDFYVNLMKTIQKKPYTCMQRINQL